MPKEISLGNAKFTFQRINAETSLLKSGENLFKRRNMFFPRIRKDRNIIDLRYNVVKTFEAMFNSSLGKRRRVA